MHDATDTRTPVREGYAGQATNGGGCCSTAPAASGSTCDGGVAPTD